MRSLLLSGNASRWPELQEALRARGHDVTLEDQPERALAQFAASPFDLVVVDLIADRERGLAFCRRLRERDDGVWSVVLVMTANSQPHEVEEAIRAGADDYLSREDSTSVCASRVAIAEHRFKDKQGRRAVLQELSHTESRFQELLETAPDAIIGCNADGKISLMNEQAVRLTGYSRQALRGLSIESLVPVPLRHAHAEHRSRFFESPGTRPMGMRRDLVLCCKDGSEINVDICLGYHREGDEFHGLAAIRDITERRRMEEELRLAKEATERAYERIHREVEAAARVQQALLPRDLPSPDRVRFAFKYHPCAELAGDGLNVFWLDENHVGLYLLDVSGHGVAASLLSVALAHLLSPAFGSSTLLRAPAVRMTDAPRLSSPCDVARGLNQWLLSNPMAEQFFTMIYGILDVAALRLRYVSAGHPAMLLAHADGKTEWLRSTGLPIGVMDDAEFEEGVLSLHAGDRVLLYSDGITEAPDPAGEMFGAARLQRMMLGATGPLETFLPGILKEVLAWSHGQASDDLSMLVFQVEA